MLYRLRRRRLKAHVQTHCVTETNDRICQSIRYLHDYNYHQFLNVDIIFIFLIMTVTYDST